MAPFAEGERVALAVVDPDPKLRTRLALQLGEDADVVTYSEVAALAEYASPARPLVVVFGPGLADGAGLAEIERFTRARPDAGAILVATELSTSLLQQALRSGVRDVLGAPTEATSLIESVERVSGTLTMVPSVPTSASSDGSSRSRRPRADRGRAWWPPTWPPRWPGARRGRWYWSTPTSSSVTWR